MNHYYTRTKNIKYNTRLLIVSTSQKDKKVIFCVVFTTHFQRWYSPPVCAGVRSQFFALGFALGLDRFLAFVFADSFSVGLHYSFLALVFATQFALVFAPRFGAGIRWQFLTLAFATYFLRWYSQDLFQSWPISYVGLRYLFLTLVLATQFALVFATHFSRWCSLLISHVGTRWPFLTLALATSTRGRKSNSSPRPGL